MNAGRIFRNIRSAEFRHDLDAGMVAGVDRVVWRIESRGTPGQFGSVTTLPSDTFGVAFQGKPFFSWGVEVVDGNVNLQEGLFPFVTAGVYEWQTMPTQNEGVEPRYVGASVYLGVQSGWEYEYVFTFSFEGVVFRSPEFTVPGL